MHLLTRKPILYIANTDEEGLQTGNAYIEKVRAIAAKEDARVVPICAKIEMEIAELPETDRTAFLHELGMKEAGLDSVVRAAYDLSP